MPKKGQHYTRMPGFVTRSFPIRQAPSSLNPDERSLIVVAATQAKVAVWDWDTWDIVDEVLLMRGASWPANNQVPLLDTHQRFGIANQFGSFRNIHTELSELLGTVVFSAVKEADDVFTKVTEGHVTDYSIGYRIVTSEFIKAGESKDYDGLTVDGPCRVVTAWEVTELSICPIGADPGAKGRARRVADDDGQHLQSTKLSCGQEGANQKQAHACEKENSMADKNKKRGKRTTEEELDKAQNPDSTDDEDRDDGLDPEDDKNRKNRNDPDNDEDRDDDDESRNADGDEDSDNDQDKDRNKRSAIRAERERATSIISLCREFGMDDQARGFIDKGFSLNKVRKQVLNKLSSGQQGGPSYTVTRDERDKFRAAAQDALLLRGNFKFDVYKQNPDPGAYDLRGYSLRELARECLRQAGHKIPGDPREMAARALSTTDLPQLLVESSRRFLLHGWEHAEETWQVWTGEGTATDFKENKLIDFTVDNRLDEIKQGEEYQYGEVKESSEKYRLATFGKKIAITRQSIIDDDLEALTGIPLSYGEGASRTIGDAVYGVLVANSVMGDGKALFHSSHKNLLSGQGGAPNVDNISKAKLAMGLQEDDYGRKLNIKPKFYIAPLALEGASEVFFTSVMIGTQAQPLQNNIHSNNFVRVYEPRLDDDSDTTRYMCARPDMGIRVFYLNGIKVPFLETREGWDIDGIEIKVRMDAGVKAVSWRGLQQATA